MEIQRGGVVSKLLENVAIPKMFRATQSFAKDNIAPEDIPAHINREMSKERVAGLIKPGMKIAVTAGSRGVANVSVITKAIVDFVKSKGAQPFIVPAMGSHGGAKAEGQTEILASYGITPETMGCPIKSSMETVQVGVSEYGLPVYVDKNAYESDGIIVSCRIKPHNAFRGPYESGICKMMVVGLGKQLGAESFHVDGLLYMAQNLPASAKVILANAPIIMGIGAIENAYDETTKIVAVHRDDIMDQEPGLLKEAASRMPKILVEEGDVLVVDQIGKNFSGNGVDPNIAGTFSNPNVHGGVKVQRTCFFDVTDCSYGNAMGTGFANAITKRIFDKMDLQAIYPNCITSTVLKPACIPLIMATDKEAMQVCIRTLNKVDKAKARIIRIKNTSHIGEMMLSEAYYEDVKAGKYQGVTAVDEPAPLDFDEEGNMLTKI